MNKSNKHSRKDGIKAKNYIYIILFIVLLIIDRLAKIWAMNLKEKIDLGIFAFNYVTNTGAGFGILQNMNSILIWFSIIVLGLIIIFHDKFPKIPLLLIISGLVGNLIDRISMGRVVDFIDFKFWPVFNVADSLIVIGVVWMIIVIIKEEFIASKKITNKIKKKKSNSKSGKKK